MSLCVHMCLSLASTGQFTHLQRLSLLSKGLHCFLVSREPLLYRVEISPGFFARAVAGCRRQRYLDVMAGLCKVE